MNARIRAVYLTLYIYLYEFLWPYALSILRYLRARKIKSIKFPEDYNLIVGPTNICNARCCFCAYPKASDRGDLKYGIMTQELFEMIIDSWITGGGIRRVGFATMAGDPIIDEGLVDKIKYAVSKKFECAVTSNGILLEKNDLYKKLVDSGLDSFWLSWSGAIKDSYERVYGVDRYEQVLSGIIKLIDYNNEKGCPIKIVLCFRSDYSIYRNLISEDFVKYIKPRLGPNVRCTWLLKYDNWSGNITKDDLIGVMRLRNIPPFLGVPCHAIRSVSIRYDGTVRLCACRYKKSDDDEMIAGVFPRDGSFSEILNGERAKKIFDSYRAYETLSNVCRDCTFYVPIHRIFKIV